LTFLFLLTNWSYLLALTAGSAPFFAAAFVGFGALASPLAGLATFLSLFWPSDSFPAFDT
jgi:hypothetical protein